MPSDFFVSRTSPQISHFVDRIASHIESNPRLQQFGIIEELVRLFPEALAQNAKMSRIPARPVTDSPARMGPGVHQNLSPRPPHRLSPLQTPPRAAVTAPVGRSPSLGTPPPGPRGVGGRAPMARERPGLLKPIPGKTTKARHRPIVAASPDLFSFEPRHLESFDIPKLPQGPGYHRPSDSTHRPPPQQYKHFTYVSRRTPGRSTQAFEEPADQQQGTPLPFSTPSVPARSGGFVVPQATPLPTAASPLLIPTPAALGNRHLPGTTVPAHGSPGHLLHAQTLRRARSPEGEPDSPPQAGPTPHFRGRSNSPPPTRARGIATGTGRTPGGRRRNVVEGTVIPATPDRQAIGFLRTGEDALHYFAGAGRHDQLKFVYLNRVPQESVFSEFRPYDLVVVPREDVDREHFTMSSSGVVRVVPGQASEAVSLAQWAHEATTFNILRTMSIFRKFPLIKYFYWWKRNTRYQRFRKGRKELLKRFFAVRPSFLPTQQVILQTARLRDVQLMHLDAGDPPMKTDQYFNTQLAVRTNAATTIHDAATSISGLLSSVEADVLARAYPQGDEDGANEEDPAVERALQFTSLEKSMAQVKQEQIERQRAIRQAQIEERQLGSFVRLADTLMAEALVTAVCYNAQALLAALTQSHAARKGGTFVVTYTFIRKNPPAIEPPENEDDDEDDDDDDEEEGAQASETPGTGDAPSAPTETETEDLAPSPPRATTPQPSAAQLARRAARKKQRLLRRLRQKQMEPIETDLQMNPSCAGLEDLIMRSIDEAVTLVSKSERPIRMHAHRPFLPVPPPMGLDTLRILHDHASLERSRQAIAQIIHDSYDEAGKYLDSYRELGKVFEYGERWDDQAYQAAPHTVTEFRRELQMLATWAHQINSIKFNNACGVLFLDSQPFKQALQPIPRDCIQKIHEHLYRLFQETRATVVEMFRQHKSSLGMQTRNLKEYCEFIELIADMHEQNKVLTEDLQTAKEMKRLLIDEGVEIQIADKSAWVTAKDARKAFLKALDAAQQQRDEKRPRMEAMFEQRATELEGESLDCLNEINSGLVVQDHTDPGLALDRLEQLRPLIESYLERRDTLLKYHEIIEIEKPYEFANVADCNERYNYRRSVWSTYVQWLQDHQTWSSQVVTEIDAEAVGKTVMQAQKEATRFEKKVPDDPIAKLLRKKVEEFRPMAPILSNLCIDAMEPKHWQKLFEKIGKPYQPGLTLSQLMMCDIAKHKQLVQEVSAVAAGEFSLISQLRKIEEIWMEMNFIVEAHKKIPGAYILGTIDDIKEQLDNDQAMLQTMTASRFIVGIRDEVDLWDKRLALLSDLLEAWMQCQHSWMYLAAIFCQEDIQMQLPTEAKLFLEVDGDWRDRMNRLHEEPGIVRTVDEEGILSVFEVANEKLERIEKKLEDFLETKRVAFPRFYFLANDELLEILAHTADPTAVQPHMSKCFDNIGSLLFMPNQQGKKEIVTAMLSVEGETVDLNESILARGPVEAWLLKFEGLMKQTIHDKLLETLQAFETMPRTEWVFKYPAQAILTVDQILWTQGVTEALHAIQSGTNPRALVEFCDACNAQLQELVQLVRGQLTKLQRLAINTLVVIDVHARNVIHELIRDQATSPNDFNWMRQLRYYYDTPRNEFLVRQTSTEFIYGYEYLGNTPRLVITPLTDLCYMTLTLALHMNLGGAPSGPAGTGKTETTKDLAKALARQCVVFNCSDQLDAKMMGRFFSGLAQAGAWACFDEFNRIDIEVLSVIAQQIMCILDAIMQHRKQFVFEGNEIKLNPSCGFFITMNPGYAGRTELPDNLKALFRPVAMMIPDYALIAEIMLFSEGFQTAGTLASKMTQLYKLSSEQLSQQDHYDFGMRAVKSVLVMAGTLKRRYADLPEEIVLIRALRDTNTPKFLSEDVPLFMGIIKDLFPGVDIPSVEHGKLQQGIEAALVEKGYQPDEPFVLKAIQLFETMEVRHGVMMVGATATGKSVCTTALQRALVALKEAGDPFEGANRTILNPKSITMGELYGQFNEATREWFDGIVPKLTKGFVKQAEGSPIKQWLIFDGPVDAIWIESMNTVLDDNKMLCLSNGDRIKLPPTMTMLFEVQDLAVASPATVSRCGMVYLESVHFGWRSHARSWAARFETQFPGMSNLILYLFDLILAPALQFLRTQCAQFIPAPDTAVVAHVEDLIDALAAQAVRHRQEVAARAARPADTDAAEGGAPAEPVIALPEGEAVFYPAALAIKHLVFAIVWTLGSAADDASKAKFNAFCRPLLSHDNVSIHNTPLHFGVGPADAGMGWNEILDAMALPQQGHLYNYWVDDISNAWQRWEARVPDFTYNPRIPFHEVLVPTVDTASTGYILETLLNAPQNIHVLLTGTSGVGKTVVIQEWLRAATTKEKHFSFQINFSAQTTAAQTQDIMETQLTHKRSNLLSAPAGKRGVIFVDDVNMPAPEQYFAQPPIELLRQTIDQGGFYDRKKHQFTFVADTRFVVACGPPGGGRNKMTQRFTRHFHTVGVPRVSTASMRTIFSAVLGGFMTTMQSSTSPDVQSLVGPLIDSTVAMYSRVCKELLPTPSKSHYTFNLRDASAVVGGIMHASQICFKDRATVARLWAHEASRVFRDRLTEEPDREWFDVFAMDLLEQHFSIQRPPSPATLLFGGIPSSPGDQHVYRPLGLGDEFTHALTEHLNDYNLSNPVSLDLVFFDDAVRHLARIARIIRSPRGNALLIGVGGSGRQSLTALAAHICETKMFRIEISKNYGVMEFREDLKKALMSAGRNEPAVFVLTDTQITNDGFLEDINNLLNIGEVPNIWQPDEVENLVEVVRPLAKAAGKGEGRNEVMSHFVSLVRQNLHIVLCMSPIGDALRNRIRKFPSLVNCCTLDWYDPWPDSALLQVARRRMSDLPLDGEKRAALGEISVFIHQSVKEGSDRFYNELRRRNHTTPTSYLELLTLYATLVKEIDEAISKRINKLRSGLTTLEGTQDEVKKMQVRLTALQPQLEQSARDTAELMNVLSVQQTEMEGVKKNVEAEEAVVAAHTAETEAIAQDAQSDLDRAMPAYLRAIAAVKNLDKGDITEVKSFASPPELVRFVLEAVCILFNQRPSWDNAKRLMNPQFLNNLLSYDRDGVTPAQKRALRKYVTNEKFNPEEVGRVSIAAKTLASWVLAIDIYSKVAAEVGPKKERLAQAEAELDVQRRALAEKQKELADVLGRVNKLKEDYEASIRKKESIAASMEETKVKLERAERLLSGLSGEHTRWTATVAKLDRERISVVGDSLLAAASLAYLGPFNAKYRLDLTKRWIAKAKELHVPINEDFDLAAVLGDQVTIRGWRMCSLPSDTLSVENALICTRSRRWPLIIDPQGQANRWIKNMERDNGLKIIKPFDPTLLRTLENAIRVGVPVLLENVGETLDPSLDPILSKQITRQGGRLIIRLGDQDVDYSPEFKLYITTKLPNPHYVPEICIRATIINFTVTPAGLDDQLLADVVRIERSDLETERDRLVVQLAKDRDELTSLEDRILELLGSVTGSILDDEQVIDTLNQSQRVSSEITVRVAEAEKTNAEINEARNGYRDVSTRGSVLYFAIADLALVDPMYQYSLAFFSGLFCRVIRDAPKNDNVAEHVEELVHLITRNVYSNVCRGLFERDKALFSFMIAVQIARAAGLLSDAEWYNFLRGPTTSPEDDTEVVEANPCKGWLRPEHWHAVYYLDCLEAPKPLTDTEREMMREMPQSSRRERPTFTPFAGLAASLGAAETSAKWREWYDSDEPHRALLPAPWHKRLNAFQRLMVLRALRDDKITFGTTVLVEAELGRFFVEAPQLDLKASLADSAPPTPLIFVLSPGTNPLDYLRQLAQSKGFNVNSMSLGQGQGPAAEKLIMRAKRDGDWVCLENCHLCTSWMPRLEAIVESFSLPDADLHDDFRLWLTSMPTKHFPVSVLQAGIKLTNEPPRGLKANLQGSFRHMSSELFNKCKKRFVWRRLLFGLCFFHAVVQERRKFGSLGWNIPYEWTGADLMVSMRLLQEYLDAHEDIPFTALRYIVGSTNYGGRITDSWDVRCALSILNEYFSPDFLDDDHAITSDSLYRPPPVAMDLDQIRGFLSDLPPTEKPEVFGLHSNADITFQRAEAQKVLRTLIDIQPRIDTGSGGKTSDDVVREICADLAARLPANLDTTNAHPQVFALGPDGATCNSLGTVLAQECVRFNNLLNVIRQSLQDVQDAVRGLVVMSSQLEAMYDYLLLNRVPEMWATAAYPSLKPLSSWMADLIERVNTLDQWIKNGHPQCFWLPGFFFPQGFLTGVLQRHARLKSIPIDTLSFHTDVMDARPEALPAPATGVYIRGLFLEGARWDRADACIGESDPGVLASPMPPIWLQPTQDDLKAPPPGRYRCPVYKTGARAGVLSTTGHSTNFIIPLDLPTQVDPGHWIRRGVAMLCQLSN